MGKMTVLAICLLVAGSASAGDCPSTTTLVVKSSNYSGPFSVELRQGTRPGSRIVHARTMKGSGQAEFQGICAGRYFFAFGTPDSEHVSVTRYFDVKNDGYTYSNPVITVFYSRSSKDGSQPVASAKRREL